MIKQDKHVLFKNGQTLSRLDRNVYTIKKDSFGNVFLSQIEYFNYMELDGKSRDIEKIVCDHYERYNDSFGCIFDGVSGMGKTQNIKNISVKLGLPVIFIDSEIPQENIRYVLDNINNDCILFFDEFEKIYRESEQLLSLFDGIKTKNRVLTFVSINEERHLSKHFFGRPGRFLFRFKYHPLDEDEALKFITSRVKKIDKKRLKLYLSKIDNLSYDICDKIVKVFNLHPDKKIDEITVFINVKIAEFVYDISLYKNKLFCQKLPHASTEDEDLYFNNNFLSGYLTPPLELNNLKLGEILELDVPDHLIRTKTQNDSFKLLFTKIKKLEKSICFGY